MLVGLRCGTKGYHSNNMTCLILALSASYSVTPTFYYRTMISTIRRNFLQSLKKILEWIQSHLNFRKFIFCLLHVGRSAASLPVHQGLFGSCKPMYQDLTCSYLQLLQVECLAQVALYSKRSRRTFASQQYLVSLSWIFKDCQKLSETEKDCIVRNILEQCLQCLQCLQVFTVILLLCFQDQKLVCESWLNNTSQSL